jgi:hypothetical protein
MTARTYTPPVLAAAARLGVDLERLAGTGAGGRVSVKDVHAAAGTSRPAHLPPRNEAPARRQPVEMKSHWDPQQTILLDVYGPNPIVEDARLSLAAISKGALAQAPAPTLFADGDLPPFLASGVNPSELLKVPWYARHAVAATPDASKVLGAIEQFAHDPYDFFGEYEHQGAMDYVTRVQNWLTRRDTPRDLVAEAALEAFVAGTSGK